MKDLNMAAKQGLVVGIIAGVAVAVAAVAASGRMPVPGASGAKLFHTAASSSTMFAPPPGAPMSFADIFDKVSPAVVSIDVSQRIDTATLMQQQFGNLFGNPNGAGRGGRGGRGGNAAPGQGQGGRGGNGGGNGGNDNSDDDSVGVQQGAGSGFLISADGYIVTNNHVVDKADDITVTLTDGKKYKAKVVGTDEYTDLAVVKIDGARFPYVDFENQAKPRVGDWVITVGNPFRLGGTATAGIVSAFGRNNIGGENGQQDQTASYVDYIQIDAPINMGNSGGPTFDVFGRVIGVNSAIYSPTGGSVGIGFAIPADIAESIAKQLIAGGKVTRGYIGATVGNFDADQAAALGLGSQLGAFIDATVCGGPAAKGGLMADDIVTAVNGVAIKNSSELTREVAKVQPGGQIRLDVIRDGARRSVTVVSGTRPQSTELMAASNNRDCTDGATRTSANDAAPAVVATDRILGMAVDVNPDGPGLVVNSVTTTSDAFDKGIRRSNVILAVNLRPVSTAKQFADAVAAAKASGRPSVLLRVSADGQEAQVAVSIR
jgi:serine protease Do